MLTDEIIAPEAAVMGAVRALLKLRNTEIATIGNAIVDDAAVVTWNGLRELADRMVTLGTALREDVEFSAEAHRLAVRQAHLWRTASEYRLREHFGSLALVRADPVPCPDCGGAGGFGRGEGAEGCLLCDMRGVIPRNLADQLDAQHTLWRPIRDAWLSEQLRAIQPIDEL